VSVSSRKIAFACYGATALAVVGVFGTWSNAGPVSLDGFEGPHNGWAVVVFALIALAGVRSLSRGGWLGIILVAGCAGVMIFTAIGDIADTVLGGRSGWGVWVTIAASFGLACVAVYCTVQRIRGSTQVGPRASS
jgi:hypothetical protein